MVKRTANSTPPAPAAKLPAVFRTVAELREWRRECSIERSIGFVPTMGALHSGHASLLARARAECDVVVLSIFVNPTQFNNPDDLRHYPRTFERDLAMAAEAGVDAVFAPESMEEMYPDGYRYQVVERDFSAQLCGEHRPGHFDGVLSVVMKLFQLVRPQRAYFGEKDHQQLSLIDGMARAFFLDVEIVPCATVREADGLAMSSRNARLSAAERAQAPRLHEALTKFRDAREARAFLESQGFQVDYLEDRGSRRYAAATLGKVRLIDNVGR